MGQASNYYSLADFFRRRYGGVASVSYHHARRNFVQSVAAYSIVTYLLQLKDRHNGNILLHADGAVVHGRNLDWNLPPPLRELIIDLDVVRGVLADGFARHG